MDLDDKDLLMEHPLKRAVLDIDTPNSQMAITSLPDNFQIRTMSDIKTLEEFVALNYTKGIRLYRGHESRDYKIESTIVRHVKKNNKVRFKTYLMPKRKALICFATMFSKKSG